MLFYLLFIMFHINFHILFEFGYSHLISTNKLITEHLKHNCEKINRIFDIKNIKFNFKMYLCVTGATTRYYTLLT